MNAFDDLTNRQYEVLCGILEYIGEHGYPPTMRELARDLNLASVSTAHDHVQALKRKGYLEIKADSPRALKVVEP